MQRLQQLAYLFLFGRLNPFQQIYKSFAEFPPELKRQDFLNHPCLKSQINFTQRPPI